MSAYAIRFGAGLARRFLTQPIATGELANGWRPFVWTKDIQRAELFSSKEIARAFARKVLSHDRFEVVIAPSRGVPTDDLGGTPAAARIAA